MSTTQKIEVSREIRQWIGVGIAAFGLAISFYACIAPARFQKNVEKLKSRLNLY